MGMLMWSMIGPSNVVSPPRGVSRLDFDLGAADEVTACLDEAADLPLQPLGLFGEVGELCVHEGEHRIARWTPNVREQRDHLSDFLHAEALTSTVQDESKPLKMTV